MVGTGRARWTLAAALLAALGCSKAVPVAERGDPCGRCHSSPAAPVPFLSAHGRTATADPGAGAHSRHLGAGSLRAPLACGECHPVPEKVYVPGHLDNEDGAHADLRFAALAGNAGLKPRWDKAALTCSATWCHGAGLEGGSATEPVWNRVDGTQSTCGSCHGAPPPLPHPQRADCHGCHAGTVRADGTIDVEGGQHIDGVVQAPTAGCTTCHGDPARTVAPAAPPTGTRGESATSALAVGAHQAHLAGSRLRAPLACEECHLVPGDLSHIDGTAALRFGPLARSDGAQPAWNRQAATCSATYCHGGTLTGGSVPAPQWTKVDGTQAACGACHGLPPPAPHPQVANCNQCHPGTVNPDGTLDARGGLHLDGVVEVQGLTCTSCHGSAQNAAPPAGTHGETVTTARAVGAHQQHLAAGPLAKAIACSECHALPTAMTHADGQAQVAFGALARTGGSAPAWDGTGCSATWCHGAGLAGGTNRAPLWTKVDGTQAACGTCHGSPPPAPHPLAPNGCSACHPGTVRADGSIDVQGGLHVDGVVEVSGAACSACHGSAVNAAPPQGTHGETATSARAVGAHQRHLADGPVARAVPCAECHTVPTSGLHADGTVSVTFGALARQGGAAPVWNGATCSAAWCHGNFAGGNAANAPTWTKVDGTQAACGTCHGNPPPAPHPGAARGCNPCHPGTVKPDGTLDVAGGLHVDGVVEVANLTCTSCHGSGADPAPPAGTHGETATSARAVGAHQQHLKDGPLRPALDCTECHLRPASNTHANGVVELAWGPLATAQAAAPRWDGTACSASYCHGNFAGGNAANAPEWTRVDGSQAACGTCHALPPANHAPGSSRCGACHAGYTAASVNLANHINGRVDVIAVTCTSCHGDPNRLDAAPPNGTQGETATTTRAVGAHQTHLTLGPLRKALACGDCHVVPTSTSHSDGAVKLTFGPLATTGGASPQWNGTSCSAAYCHGNFAGGNAANAPQWTKVDGTQAACGTCHALPPALAAHPPRSDCQSCHPGYTSSSVDVNTHMDGTVQHAPLGCSSCHGGTANAAPPLGTHGETATTALAVGAHQKHLLDGAIRSAVACGECHAVPSSNQHSDGAAQVSFGALARTGGLAATWTRGTATCSATWCHGGGAGILGGTAKAPVWTKVDGTQSTCGSCHGAPPPAPHPQAQNCAGCHPGTVGAGNAINVAGGLHVDGKVDKVDATCTSCHGDASRPAAIAPAPPIGTRLETLTTARAVGAHQSHLNAGPMANAIACTECHVVPTSTSHMNGTVTLTFGALAKTGGKSPAWNGATCSATYCHGNFTNGASYAPTWTKVDGTQAACGTCHLATPTSVRHGKHIGRTNSHALSGGKIGCADCHDAYTATTVNKALHVDGKKDVSTSAHTGWNSTGRSCSNACHGTETWQ